jgi:hypothetical protein
MDFTSQMKTASAISLPAATARGLINVGGKRLKTTWKLPAQLCQPR